MKKALLPLLALAGTALVGSILYVRSTHDDGAAQAQSPRKPVYESSIGGVVPASNLPGKVGQGYLVYSKWCSGCHAPDFQPSGGKEAADKLSPISRTPLGTALLRQRYKGSVPADLESRTDLTPEIVSTFVRNGLNAMPPFRKTEITDADLDALSAYLSRNTKTDPPH